MKRLAAALLGGALLFAHWSSLVGMVQLWQRSPMYSYAFTVPVISLVMLWLRRGRVRDLRPAPDRLPGAITIGAGLALLLGGRAGSVQVFEQLAFLVSLTGVVLFTLGRAHLRVVAAPLAYLLLMIPFWDGLTERLHMPFQLGSASVGLTLLHWVGIPAYREGTFITLPNLTIEVARACSGVNYLVAVLALGVPLCYVYLHDTWRRVVLLTSAIAIAALSNALRVALIGALVYLEIGSPLHGPFHVLHGLFVAGIGYVCLFAGLRLLEKGDSRAAHRSPVPITPAIETSVRHARIPLRTAEVMAIVAVFTVLGTTALMAHSVPVPLSSPLSALPMQVDNWIGGASEALPPQAATWWPGADETVTRRYRRLDGAVIDVYVGYFASQEQGRELAGYRSAPLHRDASARRVTVADGSSIEVALIRSVQGRPVTAMVWYEMEGVHSTELGVKASTIWSSLTRNRSNGAAVMISVVSWPSGRSAEESIPDLDKLAAFVHNAVGSYMRGGSTTENSAKSGESQIP